MLDPSEILASNDFFHFFGRFLAAPGQPVINELIRNDIEPIITTIHFDMPFWVAEKYNGFSNDEVIELYKNMYRPSWIDITTG